MHARVEFRLTNDFVIGANDCPEHAATLHGIMADIHDVCLHGCRFLEECQDGRGLETPVAIKVGDA